MIDALHNSHVTTFRRCGQQFKYQFIENIERKRPSLPLARGIWVHYMLEAQYLRWGIEKESLLITPETIQIDGVEEVTVSQGDLVLEIRRPGVDSRAYELSAAGMLELLTEEVWSKLFPQEQEDLTEGGLGLPEQAQKMVKEYFYHHRHTMKAETPLLVEASWRRKFTDDIDMEGRLDLLLQDEKGLIVLRDWKTSKWSPSPIWKFLQSQLHLYPWGITPLLKEHGIEKVHAVEFDWISASLPTTPSRNQDGSLSKRKIKTTALTYKEALKEYKMKVTQGHKDEIERLESEGGNDFFVRQRMPLNPKVTEELLGEMKADYYRMIELFDNPLLATRTVDRSCDWACDYLPLCMGELYGQDVSNIRKKDYQPRQTRSGKQEEDER